MKAPVYVSLDPGQTGNACTCSLCGALVLNRDTHTSWHAAQARLLGLEDDE
jgi:hypothetical protein